MLFQAFMDAWEDTCNYIGSKSTMEIPQGRTFLLQPIGFHGPCKSKKIVFSVCNTYMCVYVCLRSIKPSLHQQHTKSMKTFNGYIYYRHV